MGWSDDIEVGLAAAEDSRRALGAGPPAQQKAGGKDTKKDMPDKNEEGYGVTWSK